MASEEDLRQEIALEAYYRHLARGGAQEQDLDDWLEAERLVLQRHRAVDVSPANAAREQKASKRKEQTRRK